MIRNAIADFLHRLSMRIRGGGVDGPEHGPADKPLTWDCHDCGAPEGYLHLPGCDMEDCPICDDQLIICGHWDEVFGEDGVALVERTPYILYPNLCARCGKPWPEMFHVSDEEWERYIPPRQRDVMLCRDCYQEIVAFIEEGAEYERTL